MIVEHALLNTRSSESQAFEKAMRQALPLIEATPGFVGMELRPCVERENVYLLLVQWRSVEDHDVGFRQSERYKGWRSLLHRFYEPFPEVLHFEEPVIKTNVDQDTAVRDRQRFRIVRTAWNWYLGLKRATGLDHQEL